MCRSHELQQQNCPDHNQAHLAISDHEKQVSLHWTQVKNSDVELLIALKLPTP